jgi:hypothetical protein
MFGCRVYSYLILQRDILRVILDGSIEDSSKSITGRSLYVLGLESFLQN